MILVNRTFTADDTDALANTDLANIPAMGGLEFWFGSTQNDTLLTITGPGQEPVIRLRPIQLRTNGQPLLSDDQPIQIGVAQGGHYVVNIDIVTAATVVMVVKFTPVDEM